ncbi:biotin/lipoate A/B protein ligase family protein [Tychonema sp. LEGE 07203]|uniref:lipoate--protein ligase family protein n=1 Tax=Tychonema sp. LEGE 07203 TaxID=1828671 RepID=UPI001882612B|nr:biotin/lipoate A/B protein ligase family protein [Tychonema sp. LEGE 07203]MBE9096842.1 lipoate--protein ligase family protein [Tychonema sp. LEGE 07203]
MANSVWRLIPLLSASGMLQMAIDKWLLQQHLAQKHPPTLRFYTWQPAAISLGYHQQRWPEFWQQLSWQGMPVELVRRPSGGRAVLHQGDLTYAVVASEFGSSRLKAYQTMCEFLIEGWRAMGLDLHYGEAKRGYIHNPNCFGTATGADLVTADGCKLIGSAQLRRGDAILQHGSMRLQPDVSLFDRVFDEKLIPVKLPLSQTGDDLIATVIDILSAAACRCFEIDLEVQPLSEEEWQDILKLTTNNLCQI